ncbi:MAG: hypothetical protein IT341_04760 [Chloroflexi bacterium]|nr:hypothetical protein [Chloroflexota bacterium]
MMQAMLVARVTLRELWVTFRLVLLLAAFIGGSAVATLLPGASTTLLDRLAALLAVATAISAALAAWTMAANRTAGRAGWLVSRSVTRHGYLAGLFCGVAGVGVFGAAASMLLGWLAALSLPVPPAAPVLAAALLAAVGAVLAAIAIGMAVGALLQPLPSAIVAGILVAAGWFAIATAGTLLAGGALSVPSIGRMLAAPTAFADALRFAGAALLTAALALTLAVVAIDRAEL